MHTQWPGSGTVGDPIFDQFMAETLPMIGNPNVREAVNRDATIALLSGAAFFAIADARIKDIWVRGDLDRAFPRMCETFAATRPTAVILGRR